MAICLITKDTLIESIVYFCHTFRHVGLPVVGIVVESGVVSEDDRFQSFDDV